MPRMEDGAHHGSSGKRRDSQNDATSSLLQQESVGSVNTQSEPDHVGTLVSGTLNITQTILGAGILAMPSAIANVGVVLGSVLILTSASTSAFGLYLLSLLAQKSGRNSSFFSCSKMTWPNLAMFFDIAIAIKCFGVSVSYLVICRDLLPQVVLGLFPGMGSDSIYTSRIFWVSICMWIISPFAFAKRLSSLKYVSALALCFVVYLAFVVVYFYSVAPTSTRPPDIRLAHVDSHFFLYLPIFVFAFTCHQNIFSIHNEINDNSIAVMKKLIGVSISISTSVYLVIGIFGYLTFGNLIKSNIIAMYPSSFTVTCGQLAIALLVLFSYPLQCHPCRNSIQKIISSSGNAKKYHFLITTLIMAFSYLIAISVEDLTTVLSVVGATGSTTICYILPGLFYFKYRDRTDPINAPWDLKKTAALFLAGTGTLIMSTCLTMQIIQKKSVGH